MLNEFTYMKVFGLPLIVWGGMGTFLLVAAAAGTALANRFLGAGLPADLHFWLGVIALVAGLFHGLLGLASHVGLK